jgi:hypothetical protein
MRLFMLYDKKTGQIISASKTNFLDESLEHPYGLVIEDQGVLEVAPDDKLEALDCHEISEQYVVDVKKQKLKSKPARRSGW